MKSSQSVGHLPGNKVKPGPWRSGRHAEAEFQRGVCEQPTLYKSIPLRGWDLRVHTQQFWSFYQIQASLPGLPLLMPTWIMALLWGQEPMLKIITWPVLHRPGRAPTVFTGAGRYWRSTLNNWMLIAFSAAHVGSCVEFFQIPITAGPTAHYHMTPSSKAWQV